MTANEAAIIEQTVRAALEQFQDVRLKAALEMFLVPPYPQHRQWSKREGNGSRTRWIPEIVQCWIVANFRGYDVGIAFAQKGHGANGYIWNLVGLADEYLDSGNNACYRTLEDLAKDCDYLDEAAST